MSSKPLRDRALALCSAESRPSTQDWHRIVNELLAALNLAETAREQSAVSVFKLGAQHGAFLERLRSAKFAWQVLEVVVDYPGDQRAQRIEALILAEVDGSAQDAEKLWQKMTGGAV